MCRSYAILCPAIARTSEDPKKATSGILEKVALDAEFYKLGHTKAGS